jgi:excisionase family DNA binding protein
MKEKELGAQEDPTQRVRDCVAHDRIVTPKLLLSVTETAELLGVSKRTVFLLLSSGELKRRKVRRRTVIHRDEVFRFAAGAASSRPESD